MTKQKLIMAKSPQLKPNNPNDLDNRLEILLMDILLQSENPVKRYPLGQLKKRIGDFISSELQSVFEEIDSCQTEGTDGVHPVLIKGFDWNKYADIRQKYLGKEEKI